MKQFNKGLYKIWANHDKYETQESRALHLNVDRGIYTIDPSNRTPSNC